MWIEIPHWLHSGAKKCARPMLGVVRIGSSSVQEEEWGYRLVHQHQWRIRFGALLPPAAPRSQSNLPATRPAPALVMAGEVGPTALALAKVLMVMATSMVGLLGVEGGLSPPDSSRDGTDFHHFPATTDEKGEQLKIFPFFILSLSIQNPNEFCDSIDDYLGVSGHGLHLSQSAPACSFLGNCALESVQVPPGKLWCHNWINRENF